ncbi:MAG: 1-(5-phosphoribosyl)-5-[(5-phosphoribosylamino)methylideneamino]imidazole-4-carboxamide isomerase [Candidatus Aureabacteria bacterium]|nr:1-(5-phosphoribosyl)-5-[(5-phosphoribosylamino)methylideneamino]imidazole-4-carboxamide isomerase [Candidatus Auribacterota bacterium]
MLILPAVDIKNGKCVRLFQGRAENETVYSTDPAAMAKRWEGEGAEYLHIVDLDGAFQGRPVNIAAVEKILAEAKIPVQVGGGMRTSEAIEHALAAGVSRVIVGTKAAESLDFAETAFKNFRERVLPSIDAREGKVAVSGWAEETGIGAVQLGADLKKIGFRLAIYTDISRDGTLSGLNFSGIENFLDETGLSAIVAGGVSTLDDVRGIRKLERKGAAAVVIGKALYAGTISLPEAIAAAK